MKTQINGLSIDYSDVGKKNNRVLVFLHGWPLYKEKYSDLINLLSKNFRIISLDFPGFGQSELPKTPWTNQDYANFLKSFLSSINISKYTLIGHSFGGRIILKYSSQNPKNVENIILIGSSGIERKSLKVKTISFISSLLPKKIKKILLPLTASKDYLESQGVMRETFKKVINENFEKDIAKIKIPTLLIWGEEDHTTPLWQAKILNNLIKNSKLITIADSNHGLPYRQPQKVAKIIDQFLK